MPERYLGPNGGVFLTKEGIFIGCGTIEQNGPGVFKVTIALMCLGVSGD